MKSGQNKLKEPMQDDSSRPTRPKTRRAIDIHGGRIIQSTGRKDRHSKVCTARGPRDRRVRLSPNTAIQFYDVQDRLGYDRPSKAIDWLMKEAKSAIDALDNDGDGEAARVFENGLKFGHGQVQSQEYLNGIPFGNCSSFSVENGQFLAFPNAANGQEQSLMMIPESFQRLFGWNSNSSNNLEDSNLSVQYPSIPVSHYGENQLHHLQREPLQSSTTFFPNIREPIHSQFSDDHHHGGLSVEIQDLEDQVPASGKKPFSSISLLHYQQN